MFGMLGLLGKGFGSTGLVNEGGEIPTEVIDSLTAFGKAKVNFRQLIATSSVFQDAIGVVGDSEYKIESAKARIHLTAYQGSGQYNRPFAVIMRNTNDKISHAGSGTWVYGGDLELRFEREIIAGHKDNPDNAELDFENFYESVMAECMARGQEAGFFAINDYSVIEGPMQYEEEGGVFVYGIRLNVNWGLEPS